MPYLTCMSREQLLKAIRKWCRKNGVELIVDKKRGKWSHCIVTVGTLTTTIKSGILFPSYVRLVLKQLGIPRDAL